MTQQLYSWAFIPEKWKCMSIYPICMQMFVEVFVIVQNWKPPRCPAMDNW